MTAERRRIVDSDDDDDSAEVKHSKRSSRGTVSKQKEPVSSESKQNVNGEVARSMSRRSSSGGAGVKAAKENHCIDTDKQVTAGHLINTW